MSMEIQMIDNLDGSAKLRVVGIGGGGNNALNNMIAEGLKGVEFIAANTDLQALEHSKARVHLQLGQNLTRGLGAGADPEVGRQAALEDRDKIKELLAGSDMVFVTAGLGGGTGTGGAPVIAEVAKEVGALTVAVVTKPFDFEGKRRLQQAEHGVEELKKVVDTLIVIPNVRLRSLAPKNARFADMLKKADEVLLYAVRGISDLIITPGLINLDFADVKAVMSNSGLALMGTGIASGEGRAKEAAMRAITSPLLEDVSIEGAKGVLMNISCSPDMTIEEVSEAANIISKEADPNAQIFFGTVFDADAGDEMRITVIATGIDNLRLEVERPSRSGLALVAPKSGIVAPPTRRMHKVIMSEDRNIPAYLRANPAEEAPVAEPQAALRRAAGGAAPGEEEFIFEEDELDVPAFIRKKAD